jgi:triosephosphate isomerase
MLLDVGCTHVILGHSERRSLFHESDEFIDQKAKTAVALGLVPIVCIGETLAEREAGKTMDVLKDQLAGSLRNFREAARMPHSTILAYEPVWAIGTGKTASPDQAQEAHGFIRRWVEEMFDAETAHAVRILYGGSVKPDNAAELMAQPDIDGALVGGASLKVDSFIPIIRFRDK